MLASLDCRNRLLVNRSSRKLLWDNIWSWAVFSATHVTHQFVGGPPPAPPGKDACGVDPAEDELSCESFAACPAGG